MAGSGQLAFGLAAARVEQPHTQAPLRTLLWFCTLSFLPDVDVIAFRLGIPYAAPFGHRGAVHSFAFALAFAAVLSVAGPGVGLKRWRAFVWGAVLLVLHDLVDTLTDGGLGIALLWPFSHERFFAPWQPIPVAPIGRGMLSHRGLLVTAAELALFSPLFLWAAWPRRKRRPSTPAQAPTGRDASARSTMLDPR